MKQTQKTTNNQNHLSIYLVSGCLKMRVAWLKWTFWFFFFIFFFLCSVNMYMPHKLYLSTKTDAEYQNGKIALRRVGWHHKRANHSNAFQTASEATAASQRRRLKRFICELCKSKAKTISWICASIWVLFCSFLFTTQIPFFFLCLIFLSLFSSIACFCYNFSEVAWRQFYFSWREKKNWMLQMLLLVWTKCFIIFVTHGIQKVAEHPDKIYRLLYFLTDTCLWEKECA